MEKTSPCLFRIPTLDQIVDIPVKFIEDILGK